MLYKYLKYLLQSCCRNFDYLVTLARKSIFYWGCATGCKENICSDLYFLSHYRRARFAGSGCPAVHRTNRFIPRSSSSGPFGITRLKHQTVLPKPNRVPDRTGRTLDLVPEALLDVRAPRDIPAVESSAPMSRTNYPVDKTWTNKSGQT